MLPPRAPDLAGGSSAIDERTRYEIFQDLERVLGSNSATALMEHLPPVGWADVATRRDLDGLAVATKRDLDALARKLHGEIAGVRGEIAGLASELRAEMAGLAGELRAEMAGLAGALRAEMGGLAGQLRAEMAVQTRTMITTCIACMIGFGGMILAGAQLA